MSGKWTPGPWHVSPKDAEESFFEDVNILRHDGLAVAVAVHNGNIDPDTVMHNARVCAAGPTMALALAEIAAKADLAAAACDNEGRASGFRILASDAQKALSQALGEGQP